jgi:hypothetical protein
VHAEAGEAQMLREALLEAVGAEVEQLGGIEDLARLAVRDLEDVHGVAIAVAEMEELDLDVLALAAPERHLGAEADVPQLVIAEAGEHVGDAAVRRLIGRLGKRPGLVAQHGGIERLGLAERDAGRLGPCRGSRQDEGGRQAKKPGEQVAADQGGRSLSRPPGSPVPGAPCGILWSQM